MRDALEKVVAKYEYWKSMYEREGSNDYVKIMDSVLKEIKEVLETETNNTNSADGNGSHDRRNGQTD